MPTPNTDTARPMSPGEIDDWEAMLDYPFDPPMSENELKLHRRLVATLRQREAEIAKLSARLNCALDNVAFFEKKWNAEGDAADTLRQSLTDLRAALIRKGKPFVQFNVKSGTFYICRFCDNEADSQWGIEHAPGCLYAECVALATDASPSEPAQPVETAREELYDAVDQAMSEMKGRIVERYWLLDKATRMFLNHDDAHDALAAIAGEVLALYGRAAAYVEARGGGGNG